MTIVVGTDTYISIVDADAYWSARNNSTWSAADTADKEKALIEATQYIDSAYSFIGTQHPDNVLCFPRLDVYISSGNFAGVSYDSVTIPPQIENACCELAIEALSSRLVEVKERGGAVKREKVDVVEIEYLDFAPTQKTYNYASMLLKPLLSTGKNQRSLVR